MPAFFVDGQMEQKFIQNICPKAKVQLINCNGDDVKLEAIADRLASLIRLMRQRFSPVIVIIDREKRQQSAEQVQIELKSLLEQRGVDVEVMIGVADRMMENWILADEELKVELSGETRGRDFEGIDGKQEIKKWIRPYHETVQGVALLRRCRPSRMQSSDSFRKFFEQLRKDKSLKECWWINQD